MAEGRKRLRERLQDALAEDIKVDDKKLDRRKWPDLASARAAAVAAARAEKVATIRAQAAVEQFTQLKPQGDPVLGFAELQIAAVRFVEPGGVEVWLGQDGGEPQFRIFNPPTLVPDPAGDVVVGEKRYREDPLAAVAAAINSTRGRQRSKR